MVTYVKYGLTTGGERDNRRHLWIMRRGCRVKGEWFKEESIAHIHGWDFSHIGGRYEEEQDRYSMTVSGILRHRFISVGKP